MERTDPVRRRGLLVVLSGPSGAGKGTLCRAVLERFPSLRFSVSATTREPRTGEEPGRDYVFVDRSDFRGMIRDGAFLEWAEVYGNLYGTPRVWVETVLDEGYSVLMDIDTQGAMQVRDKCPDAVLIFVVAPSPRDLEMRLRGRGTESEGTLQRRLDEAKCHLALVDRYDYLVVNDSLESAVARLCAIITAEGCRVKRQDPEILMRLSDGERG